MKRKATNASMPKCVKRAKTKSRKNEPGKTKKTKLTLTLKPRASLKPTPTNLTKPLPLPNGEFQVWLVFEDNGGYCWRYL
jgi:hypothetical protein